MAAVELETGGDVDALALAEAYAKLLAAGDTGELVVRIAEPPARIDLVPDGSPWYEVPFAVRIEVAGDPMLLRDVPIRVVGRHVRLVGLALGALIGDGLQIVAREGVELERCALVRLPDRRTEAAAVIRVSREDASPPVRLQACLLRTVDEEATGPVLLVETPGPAPVDVLLDGCDLGPGLQVVARGALRLAVHGSCCPDPRTALVCAPGDVSVEAPIAGAPPETSALAALLT